MTKLCLEEIGAQLKLIGELELWLKDKKHELDIMESEILDDMEEENKTHLHPRPDKQLMEKIINGGV